MPPAADVPQLIGFFSYSRDDDEDSDGAVSQLRKRIESEIASQLGRSRDSVTLWQDREGLLTGALWESKIDDVIAQSSFFVPIVTPRFINSAHCRLELHKFLDAPVQSSRSALVFPILLNEVIELKTDRIWRAHPVLKTIGERQFADWKSFRLDPGSLAAKRAVETYCRTIVATLRSTVSGFDTSSDTPSGIIHSARATRIDGNPTPAATARIGGSRLGILAACVVLVLAGALLWWRGGERETPSEDQTGREAYIYEAANDCISVECPAASCLSDFARSFPNSGQIQILKAKAAQADSGRCAAALVPAAPTPAKRSEPPAAAEPAVDPAKKVIAPAAADPPIPPSKAPSLRWATRAQVPIAIVRADVTDVDYGLAGFVSSQLQRAGYTIAEKPAYAALTFEITNIDNDESQTGVASGRYTQWRGTMRFGLQSHWANGATEPLDTVPATAVGDSQDMARSNAVVRAVTEVVGTIDKMAGRP